MKAKFFSRIFFTFLMVLMLSSGVQAQATLKDAFTKYFLVGASLNQAQFSEADSRGSNIVKQQFNTVSPENILKWESVHPEINRYDFTGPDRYVEFGRANNMFIVGHTLVWHNQTPKWVFEDGKGNPVTRAVLLTRLRDHIHTVVGRYKGKINGWDVVNEALNEDGTMRQTPWQKIIGDDYIAMAFQFAHEADPKAELYYNDYSLEKEAKRKGAIELIKKLLAQKLPVHSVGLQAHSKMDWPSLKEQDDTIAQIAALGVKIAITELDVDVLPRASEYRGADITQNFELQAKLNPFVKGLPEQNQQALARRYADLFTVFLKHHGSIDRVTFWCVTDRDSWLNDWPVRGRTNHPLLWDRDGKTKPAFRSVLSTAREFK